MLRERAAGGRAAPPRQDFVARTGLHWLIPRRSPPPFWLTPISAQHQRPGRRLVGLVYYGVRCSTAPSCRPPPVLAAQPPALPVARHRRQRLCNLLRRLRRWRGLSGHCAGRPCGLRACLGGQHVAWLFAIIGFASCYLCGGRLPAEATSGLPVLHAHQTVTVIAVYWLLEIRTPPVAGFISPLWRRSRHVGDLYLCRARSVPASAVRIEGGARRASYGRSSTGVTIAASVRSCSSEHRGPAERWSGWPAARSPRRRSAVDGPRRQGSDRRSRRRSPADSRPDRSRRPAR